VAGKVLKFSRQGGATQGCSRGFVAGNSEAAGMAGTVVLDDVELREAQRDYLDFLDDEVRRAASGGSGGGAGRVPC
jgi:hypothetical protein